MNRFLYFVLIVVAFCCCDKGNKEETFLIDSYPQKWELISITNSMNGDVLKGEDLLWQEFYILYADNSFHKTRKSKDGTIVAHGTFLYEGSSHKKYLYFSYLNDSPIIVNCTKEFSEHIQFDSELSFYNTSFACDNPILVYERTE